MLYCKRSVSRAMFLALAAGITGSASAQTRVKTEAAAPTFEIYADKAGEYRWRLVGADGSTECTSGEGYKDKAGCKKAVERIKSEVKGDKLAFEVYEDKAKEQRWRLKAKNGEIVAASPGSFKSKADADKAIEAVKKDAPQAKVEEKDADKESGKDTGKDSGKAGGKDSGKDSGKDAGKDTGKDSGKSAGAGAGKGTDKDSGAATFEIYTDAAKEFRWRLRGGDGTILASSGEGFKEKAKCKDEVETVKSGVKDKLTFELYEDKAKEHRWRLKTKSGDIVAAAPKGYKSKDDCQAAVDAIKKGAPGAKVEEKEK